MTFPTSSNASTGRPRIDREKSKVSGWDSLSLSPLRMNTAVNFRLRSLPMQEQRHVYFCPRVDLHGLFRISPHNVAGDYSCERLPHSASSPACRLARLLPKKSSS